MSPITCWGCPSFSDSGCRLRRLDAIEVAEKRGGMDVDHRSPLDEVVGHVVVLLVTCNAVAANLDEVRRIVRAASVDISPALHQVLDHVHPATMRRLPQHRPTARADTGEPTGPLFEDRVNGLHVAPCRGGCAYLQEVGGLSCEPDLWQFPPSPADLNAGRHRSIRARRVTALPGVETLETALLHNSVLGRSLVGSTKGTRTTSASTIPSFGSWTFTLVPRRQ